MEAATCLETDTPRPFTLSLMSCIGHCPRLRYRYAMKIPLITCILSEHACTVYLHENACNATDTSASHSTSLH
eukprot:6208998-Pleurochrysis_carterae.AAC.1